jgi:hypothetical protein
MLSRYRRFSAAPALSILCSNLPCKNLLARVGPQLAPVPTAALLSSSRRSFGSSCCPTSTPGPEGLTPPSVNLNDSGPLPSFLMNRAIRYSQARSIAAPPPPIVTFFHCVSVPMQPACPPHIPAVQSQALQLVAQHGLHSRQDNSLRRFLQR